MDKIVVFTLVLILSLALAMGHAAASSPRENPDLTPHPDQEPLLPVGGIQISVDPPTPTTRDVIEIAPSGVWSNSCIPRYQSHRVVGDVIAIYAETPPPGTACLLAIMSWGFTLKVGTLSAGTYSVQIYINGRLMATTSLPVLSSECCPQIIGDQFYLCGKRYFIKGLNYYEKDHSWDLFWPYWHDERNRATVDYELGLARTLGVNTLRIFLRWDFFTTSSDNPAVPLDAKRDLDEFLNLAADKQMKVLITLSDGMPNQGSGSLYRAESYGISEAHLDSLLEAFENRQGVAVNFTLDHRILAWDVKNEPGRDYDLDADGDGIPGTPKDREAVQAWVKTVIGHVRDKDSCHPITVGVYGAVDGVYDPGIISDYVSIIDFLSMHYSLDEKKFPGDVNAVEAIAGGKPVVIEEFALHTWSDDPTDPHTERDQAAYYNAILSTVEADHLAGVMFWTLPDFSYIQENDERLKHVGILRNHLITTTEVLTPTDYGEKPAASVVRAHFRPWVAYLDTFDGYVDSRNCEAPLGWTDNRAITGATIMTCGSTAHDFAPSQIGRARLTKLGGPDGVVTSPVLEGMDVEHSPYLTVEVLTYTVADTLYNQGPVDLDIGVKAIGEASPIWLATNLIDSSVDPGTGLNLPKTLYLRLPRGWSAGQDFQIIFRLQDHVPGRTGYSAGFELGSIEVGPMRVYLPILLKGSISMRQDQHRNKVHRPDMIDLMANGPQRTGRASISPRSYHEQESSLGLFHMKEVQT